MNKKYYKNALEVAWPSVLESFFVVLAGIIDTYMVSSLGKEAVAAVGLTNQPKFIAFSFFMSINVAVSALVARRKGEDDKKGANTVLVTALTMAAILFVIVMSVFVSYSRTILIWAGSKSDTIDMANTYLRIILGFSFFNIFSMIINAAQRGSGNTQIAFISNLISSIVNIFFNYLLIGGNLGFPALGVKGAAIATIIGTVMAFILSLRSLYKEASFVSLPFIKNKKIKPKAKEFKVITSLGSNMLAENMAMRTGFMATAWVAAQLGTDEFAAYNVGMQILSIGFAFADGMQIAAVSLSGQSLGSGNKEEAKLYGHVCQRIGMAISFVLSIIQFTLGKDMFKIFFKEAHIIEYGVWITKMIALIVILQISQIIYGGCLRAGGDVKYTLMAGIVSVSIIRTAATFIFVYLFHWKLFGIWAAVMLDQFCRLLFMSIRFKQGKWVNIKI